jgi:hypothetical protein
LEYKQKINQNKYYSKVRSNTLEWIYQRLFIEKQTFTL